MADKESSVQEDFDDIAFERVDFGKKETASSFI